jgi:hypothetical protein
LSWQRQEAGRDTAASSAQLFDRQYCEDDDRDHGDDGGAYAAASARSSGCRAWCRGSEMRALRAAQTDGSAVRRFRKSAA